MLGDDIESWPADWKSRKSYSWPSDSFIISGPLEYYNYDIYDIITLEKLKGRGGREFKDWWTAYSWIKQRYSVLEVLFDAEKYGRWAFRVRGV